jgi:hypothetical protein
MRTKLQALEEERKTFTGIFERVGRKPGYRGSVPTMTVLLKDIRNVKGKFLTAHVWLNYTKNLQHLNLDKGDRIEFQARVKEYRKGSSGTIDYRLSHTTQVKKS